MAEEVSEVAEPSKPELDVAKKSSKNHIVNHFTKIVTSVRPTVITVARIVPEDMMDMIIDTTIVKTEESMLMSASVPDEDLVDFNFILI